MYEVYYRKHARVGSYPTHYWCRVPGQFNYEEARGIAKGMVRHGDVIEANVVRVVETFFTPQAEEARVQA